MNLENYNATDLQELSVRVTNKSNAIQQLLKNFLQAYPTPENDFVNMSLNRILLEVGKVVGEIEARGAELNKPTVADGE